ncbi:MAG: Fic family protein [bacterium]
MGDKPPYSFTEKIFILSSDIERILGRYEGIMTPRPSVKLRRSSRIKTIQGSLEIEGNKLTQEQVTAILDGKRVLGPQRDILEVKNAIRLYDQAASFNILSEKAFRKAHAVLMEGLVKNPGKWRTGNIGVIDGSKVKHIAPKPTMVAGLISDLFEYLKAEEKKKYLISSCVFHYELEFIHPFEDGNGRMGRFWQHLILAKYHPLFEYVPVESVIRDNQEGYYSVLEQSDKIGESTAFIEFCLKAILDSLAKFVDELKPEPLTAESRLAIARDKFGKQWFSRKDYIAFFKTISTATASRDMLAGITSDMLQKRGEKAVTEYRFTSRSD